MGGVREADADADEDSLHDAGEDPAVAAVAGPCTDRYLFPRQGGELGEQLRLVLFHGEDVVRTAIVEEPGGGPLACTASAVTTTSTRFTASSRTGSRGASLVLAPTST